MKIEGSVEDAVAYYSALPNVKYAEPDYHVSVAKTPNDPKYNENDLWNMFNAQAAGAWDITTGSDKVIVAVVDTGINYNHEDLKDNMWTNETDGSHGYDFVNNDNNPMDDHGHGTHCAGTIGAVGNNGKGVVGMAWDVSLMAVKVMDAEGQGASSTILQGMLYAADNGANIISMSLGGVEVSLAERDVIRSISDNVTVVVAAGNEGSDNDRIYKSPANIVSKNLISIAAIDKDNKLAYFSNYGLHNVDVASPGVNILSASHDDNSGYLTMSGTSMAAPHVAGIAASVWSVNNNLTGEAVKEKVCSSLNIMYTNLPIADMSVAIRSAYESREYTKNRQEPENETGTLMGFVVDADTYTVTQDNGIGTGAIEGAEVTLKRTDGNGETQTFCTTGGGHFEAVLPEGKYMLEVNANGYEPYKWSDEITVFAKQVTYLSDWIKMKNSKLD